MTVKYNFKYKPFDHQQVALDHGCFEEEFGYFMEMGTGKSKVLIDNIGRRMDVQGPRSSWHDRHRRKHNHQEPQGQAEQSSDEDRSELQIP
jgi:hypothetical protein